MKVFYLRSPFYLIFLILSSLTFLDSAQAGALPDANQKNAAIYAQLSQLIAKRNAEGTLPKLSIPSDAQILNAFWDQTLIGNTPYSAADMEPLMDIYDRQRAVLSSYVFFGKDKADATLSDNNAMIFQDETTRASLLLISLTSALTAAASDFIVHLPKEQLTGVRRDGFKKMRTGYFQLVAGIHKIMTDPRLGAANRSALAKSIADNLPLIAEGMASPDRQYLASALEPRVPLLPSPEQRALDTAVATMMAGPCTNLCAIP